ncbi:MAG: M15 family metallopeptidase [Candidatus Absconditabacterales bacterium]
MNTNTLNLVPLSAYQVPCENYYFHQCDRFGTSKEELSCLFGIGHDVYVNQHIAQVLINVHRELQDQGLGLLVKDGYRSVEFYDFLDGLRTKTHPTRKDKLLNVSKKYPHSTGNTVDVVIVKPCGSPVTLRDESLRSQEDLYIKSMATMFHQADTSPLGMTIHNNRMLLKNAMESYGFIGITHEYRHYEHK